MIDETAESHHLQVSLCDLGRISCPELTLEPWPARADRGKPLGRRQNHGRPVDPAEQGQRLSSNRRNEAVEPAASCSVK